MRVMKIFGIAITPSDIIAFCALVVSIFSLYKTIKANRVLIHYNNLDHSLSIFNNTSNTICLNKIIPQDGYYLCVQFPSDERLEDGTFKFMRLGQSSEGGIEISKTILPGEFFTTKVSIYDKEEYYSVEYQVLYSDVKISKSKSLGNVDSYDVYLSECLDVVMYPRPMKQK